MLIGITVDYLVFIFYTAVRYPIKHPKMPDYDRIDVLESLQSDEQIVSSIAFGLAKLPGLGLTSSRALSSILYAASLCIRRCPSEGQSLHNVEISSDLFPLFATIGAGLYCGPENSKSVQALKVLAFIAVLIGKAPFKKSDPSAQRVVVLDYLVRTLVVFHLSSLAVAATPFLPRGLLLGNIWRWLKRENISGCFVCAEKFPIRLIKMKCGHGCCWACQSGLCIRCFRLT